MKKIKFIAGLFLLINISLCFAAFRSVIPLEISSDSPVNLKSTGATLIGRNPDNVKRLFVDEIIIYINNASGLVTPPTLSIGTNASNYNNILPATLMTASASGEYTLKIPVGTVVPINANTDVFVNVTNGAVGTTYSGRFAVEGIPTP